MTISIIIPTLNEAETIAATIAYLLDRQKTGAIGEVIVVDGGSTDNTVALAQQAGATVIHSKPGRALQMNTGAQAAQYPVLYFVHADTRPPEGYDQYLLTSIERGGTMGCFRYRFDSPSFMLRINAWFTRFSWLFCQGGDKTFFIKKEMFEKLGGYDERMTIMEEYDFLRRALQSGLSLEVLPHTGIVSARKYATRSWLKVQIANLVVFNMWRFGLSEPDKMRQVYKRLLG